MPLTDRFWPRQAYQYKPAAGRPWPFSFPGSGYSVPRNGTDRPKRDRLRDNGLIKF
jgi:hypothetical protein